MTAPRVLYLVTEPWYFANHRLDHARALLDAGFDVHVATRRGDRWDEIEQAGCTMHPIDIRRGSGSIREWWHEIRSVRATTRGAHADVVHAVALKPVALALSLLVMRSRPALILSVNGLGLSAADGGWGLRVIRTVIGLAGRRRRVTLLFQTVADRRAVVGERELGVVVPGVGVDVERFRPGSRPAPPPCRVVYLGRAVTSKGLLDLVDVGDRGGVEGVELHLYCAIDDTSPGALDAHDRARLDAADTITVHGPTSEPQVVLAGAHGAILPSRAGEGVSKFVLEALACGTPVLLSAESGSAEVIEPGRTGVVFTASDASSIRSALTELASWSEPRREEVGRACRNAAEERFALSVILPRIVELHRAAVGGAVDA